MKSIGGCLLLLAAMPVCLGTPAWVNPLVIKEIESLDSLASDLNSGVASIWPGYALKDYPLLYHDTMGKAYFFPFKKCDVPGALTDVAYPNVCFWEDMLQPPGVLLDEPIGSYLAIGLPWEYSYDTYVHEAFHAFQHKNGFLPPRSLMVETLLNERNLALAEAEQQALAEAVGADTTLVRREKISDFMRLRDMRRRLLPIDQVQAEEALETIEGTAHYVELSLLAVLFGRTDKAALILFSPEISKNSKQVRAQLIAALYSPLDRRNVDRNRYYETGAAIGFVLDAEHIVWKQRLSKGESIFAVAASAFAQPNLSTAASIMDERYEIAVRMLRYKSWLDKEKVSAEANLQRFMAQIGIKLVLRQPYSLGGFSNTMRNPLALPGKQTLCAEGSEIGKEDKNLRYQFRNSILVQNAADHFEFTTFLPAEGAPFTLKAGDLDLSALPLGTYAGKVLLAHPQARLEAAAGQISIAPKVIEITLTGLAAKKNAQ